MQNHNELILYTCVLYMTVCVCSGGNVSQHVQHQLAALDLLASLASLASLAADTAG